MQIKNLNTTINDLYGKPLMGGEGPLTLRAAMVQGLAYEAQAENGRQPSSGEDRFKRWFIANKIQSSDDTVELTAEEIALVKSKVGEAYLMIVVGPVWTMIESAKESVQ